MNMYDLSYSCQIILILLHKIVHRSFFYEYSCNIDVYYSIVSENDRYQVYFNFEIVFVLQNFRIEIEQVIYFVHV